MKHIKSGIAAFAAFMLAAAVMPVAAFAERVVSEDVTLAADTDWSGDGTVVIAPGARIDLAGHKLTVADVSQESSAITNSTGVVAGYQDLAFIRTSSSTLGYINTDIILEATDRVVFKVRYESNEKPQSFFFCSRVSNNSKQFTIAYRRDENKLRVDYGTKANDVKAPLTMTVGDTYEIDFNGDTKACTVNGTSLTFNKAFDNTYEASAPLCIFYISNNGTPITDNQYYPRASLYYFFIYGSDGTLKHELRPAIETSTSKTGLYDRTTNTFYPSSVNFLTTSAVVGVTNTANGDAAELVVNGGSTNETVAGYTVLKSITANGNQYVKVPTDYMNLASTDRVEMKVKPIEINNDRTTRCFFSSRVSNKKSNFSCFQQWPDMGGENGLRFDFNNEALLFANPRFKMRADEIHEIVFDGNMRMALVDGEDKGYDISPSNDFTPTTSLFILGAANGETHLADLDAKCELYHFRLYNKDGNLKLDMVPVYSEGESEAGLYDRVGKTFFKSASGTAFVGGENADDTTLTVTTPGVASSCSVLIDGNVKLVKDGSGVLTVAKSGQKYTGGTEVRGGTLKLGSNGNYTILPAAGTVTVCDGGTFEMDGRAGWDGRSFVLDGGTLQNSTDLRGSSGKWDAATNRTSAALLGNVTLTKDSTLRISKTYGFNDGATLNLGGHTLRAEIAKDEILVMRSAVVSNGTLNVVNGGWLCVPSGKTCDATDNADILSSTALAIAGTLNAKDFTDAKTTNANSYDSSSGAINVYGTFTPKSDYFYGVTMQSGSSFDLSTKTDPWNVASSATDNNTVSFADNAAIGLVLGERTTRGTIPVVTWTTAPANLGSLTFRRIDAGQERTAAKESSGIYFRTGLIIMFH